MADSTYIEGLGPGVPQWANESTQKMVLQALTNGLSQNTAANKQILSMLTRIANGDKVEQGHLRGAINELKKIGGTVKAQASQDRQTKTIETKQLGLMSQLLTLNQQQTSIARASLNVQKRSQELQKEGYSETIANMKAQYEKLGEQSGVIGEIFGKVTSALGAVAGAVNAVTQYTEGQARERFSFAQEIRQSGLMAGMDALSSGLIGLSETAHRTSFTLGEAAEFTRKFSQAVGVRGVEASLSFANELAHSEGANFMNRFGLQFGEVTELAGTYLESVRSMGQLDKISNDDLRSGAEEFMSTVVATSNVMKINLQESAAMIAQTLGRNDIGSLLATLDSRSRQNAEAVVGMAGGMDSILGEALAMRLAAGSNQAFVQTDQYASLLADPITAALLPIVDQLAAATETGGTAGFQTALANIGPALDAVVARGADSRSLLLTDTGTSQRAVAEAARLRQTSGDANAGFVGLTSDDTAILTGLEVERATVVAMEGMNTAVLKQADLATTLGGLYDAQAALSISLQKLVSETITPLSTTIKGAINLQTAAVEGAALTAGGVATLADLFNGNTTAIVGNTEQLQRLRNVLESNAIVALQEQQNQAARENVIPMQENLQRTNETLKEFADRIGVDVKDLTQEMIAENATFVEKFVTGYAKRLEMALRLRDETLEPMIERGQTEIGVLDAKNVTLMVEEMLKRSNNTESSLSGNIAQLTDEISKMKKDGVTSDESRQIEIMTSLISEIRSMIVQLQR